MKYDILCLSSRKYHPRSNLLVRRVLVTAFAMLLSLPLMSRAAAPAQNLAVSVPALRFNGSGGAKAIMVPALSFTGHGGGRAVMVPAFSFNGSGGGKAVMVPAFSFKGSGGTQGAGASTNAATPAMPGMGFGQSGGGGTRLTDNVMRRFVATVKDLRTQGQSVQQGKGGFAAAMAYSAGMQSTLKAHGFTLQSWATTLGLVTSAMAGMEIKKETSDPNLNAQFEAQRKSIEQAKDLSPAAKKQILQQMEQQKKNMMAVRHHEDPNEAAVRPYLKQLQAVFGK